MGPGQGWPESWGTWSTCTGVRSQESSQELRVKSGVRSQESEKVVNVSLNGKGVIYGQLAATLNKRWPTVPCVIWADYATIVKRSSTYKSVPLGTYQPTNTGAPVFEYNTVVSFFVHYNI